MDSTVSAPQLDRQTILVVDDDPGVLLLADEVFVGEGYRVVSVASGEEALSGIEQISPDIVLLDIMMPGMNGFETCQAIKEVSGFEHTPVIMLTGREDMDAIERSYELGAWDFTAKPINWPVLKHRVRYGLRASEAFSMERQAARLSKTLDSSSNEILVFDAQSLEIISANTSALSNLGYGDAAIKALCIDDVVSDRTRSDIEHDLEPLGNHQQLAVAFDLCRENGSTYPVEGIILFTADESPFSYVGIFQDISERKKAEDQLYRLAFYDDLTGLPNRRQFKEYVSMALAQAHRNQTECAVCVLDLDGFKQVNDALGHSAGDLLLKQVSDRLTAEIRHHDAISRVMFEFDEAPEVELARFGGDEFLILLTNFENPAIPAKVADRILKVISLPYTVHGQELNITTSIGVALYPQDGDSLDVLMKHADSAMYAAKNAGKNSYTYYSKELGKSSLERLTIEAQLRRAVSQNELELFYQPQIDSSDGRIVGAEALLRWHHPEQGLLLPSSFIPIAEETGLIISIGDWVLQEAISQIVRWSKIFPDDFKCAVNISALQLRQEEFLIRTRELLAQQKFPPGKLIMELTESAIMSSTQSHKQWLREIKNLGVDIAVDDFGTGYSSLSYLKKFQIDYLKIDRSFVVDVHENEDEQAVVNAIFAMARALGLEVVAEGVETLSQLQTLNSMGDCMIQGFLVSKALSVDEFEAFAASYTPVSSTVAAAG